MAEAMIQMHTNNNNYDRFTISTPRVTYAHQRNAGVAARQSTGSTRLCPPPATFLSNAANLKRGGSFIVGQKLRESKWFRHEEMKIVCAVVESGFIVELKADNLEEHVFGVAMWVPGYEKSKDPHYLTIYTLDATLKHKVSALNLTEFWTKDTQIRINNKNDKDVAPNAEDLIRKQIKVAENSKRKFHNTEHFTYYCRYEKGPVQRTKKLSEQIKWNPSNLFAKFRSLSVK